MLLTIRTVLILNDNAVFRIIILYEIDYTARSLLYSGEILRL